MEHVINRVLAAFPKILAYADANRVCKRKSVGCCILEVPDPDLVFATAFSTNGPSGDGHVCSNEVGRCGCSHAEPRAILQWIKTRRILSSKAPTILVCTYSPCTNCANIIIDSGVIDLVVYDILTEHDKRGDEFLRKELPVFTKSNLQSEESHEALRQWYLHCRNSR